MSNDLAVRFANVLFNSGSYLNILSQVHVQSRKLCKKRAKGHFLKGKKKQKRVSMAFSNLNYRCNSIISDLRNSLSNILPSSAKYIPKCLLYS